MHHPKLEGLYTQKIQDVLIIRGQLENSHIFTIKLESEGIVHIIQCLVKLNVIQPN